MIQTAQGASSDGWQWDQAVAGALETSGVAGTMVLGCSPPVSVPVGLPGLLSGLLQFLAPQAPGRLRVCTYHLPGAGCVLEVRGGRELAGLPELFTALAGRLGVKVRLFRQLGASIVLLSLPSHHPGA